MVIARVLWGFDITWPVDKTGHKIDQDIMPMIEGFMSTPAEYRATFTPRSAKRSKIFRDEWAGKRSDCGMLISSSTKGGHQICPPQGILLGISSHVGIGYFWS